MATVKADIREGSEYARDGNVISRTRAFYVSGLSGGSNLVPDAIGAVGIAIGAADPDISGLYAKQYRTAIGVGDDDLFVYLTYKSPDGTFGSQSQIEVGATASEIQTEIDGAGNPITLQYLDSGGNLWPEVPVKIPALKARSTYIVIRTESSDPSANAKLYVGYLNATAWKGQAQDCWRCLGIVGRSKDGGVTYVVTYTFEFNPDTWLAPAVYPRAPLVAGDLTLPYNGYGKFLPNAEAEFNTLTI